MQKKCFRQIDFYSNRQCNSFAKNKATWLKAMPPYKNTTTVVFPTCKNALKSTCFHRLSIDCRHHWHSHMSPDHVQLHCPLDIQITFHCRHQHHHQQQKQQIYFSAIDWFLQHSKLLDRVTHTKKLTVSCRLKFTLPKLRHFHFRQKFLSCSHFLFSA